MQERKKEERKKNRLIANLCGDDDEEGDEEGDLLTVEDLQGSNNMDSIDSTCTGVGEDGYKHMLLHVEGPGVHGEGPLGPREDLPRRQHAGHEVPERHDGYLRRYGADTERLPAVPEELVEVGQDGAGQNAENPHPERHGGEGGIVSGGHGERHLLHRRVLLLLLLLHGRRDGGGEGSHLSLSIACNNVVRDERLVAFIA